MLFNSVDFIIFFVIILAIITIIKINKFQHLLLLVGSYFFFYFSSNYLIALLIGSTLWDFYIAKAIFKTDNIKKKKILLILSISGNLIVLGFFKYANFAILQFNLLGKQFNITNEIPLLEIALPIGISFYTFQTISYTVDVYRGKLDACKSFKEFAFFVSFFPQLVAGPIVRATDFLPQLYEKLNSKKIVLRKIVINNSNLKTGITIMAFGFLKKMFFADNIAPLVNDVFSMPLGLDSFSIILGTIAFGIQIYCDFSGYSDIAIGVALILGFKIPKNFNRPYFASSPSDFWRRWHISLSSWLRDYLYIPLGGNKKSKSRTYLNLIIVMLLGGLWHGASWNFIIWGGLHGIYLTIHRFFSNRFPRFSECGFFRNRFGKIISIIVMQYFVFLAWIPFRINETEHIIYAIEKYVIIDFRTIEFLNIVMQNKFPIFLIIIFFLLHFITYKKSDLVNSIANIKLKWWFVVLTIIFTSIIFFYDGKPQEFVYFKF